MTATQGSFPDQHASIAFGDYLRYGKGRHRAALSFGDRCTYSMAKVSGQPLLYVGNDFAKTDLSIA